jgi:outer membrane protein assembly factor BamA
VKVGLLALLLLFCAPLLAQRLPVGAEGKRVLSIKFAVQTEGRQFERDPDSIARFTILNELRTRVDTAFDSNQLAADLSYLTQTSHYFRSVDWKVTLDEKLDGLHVRLIFTQPLIWRVRVVAPRSLDGVWSEDGVRDPWRFASLIDTAAGSEFSIQRVNEDIKRLYESRGFLDIRPEWVYAKDGVDVLFRVVQTEPLAGVTFCGINQTGYRSDLISILGGKKRARELASAPDDEGLVGIRYFDEPAFDFDVTIDADPASIQGGAVAIRTYYTYLGFPFVSVHPRVVQIPLKFDDNEVIRQNPDLAGNDKEARKELLRALRAAHDNGAAGRKILLYKIYEGPNTLVGEIKFTGIENIEAPGDQLSPARVPGFGKEVWAVWYAMPWTSTNDRRARALLRRMKTSAGSAFVEDDAQRDAALIQSYLRERGWREAEVTVRNRRYNETRSRVTLEFELRPGPYSAITDIRFEFVTRTPRKVSGSSPADFDKPVLTFEELLEAFSTEGSQFTPEQAAELYGAAYTRALSDETKGKYFAAFKLKEPLSYDDYKMTGDPSEALDRGIEGRIRDQFAEKVYSNITLSFEPVYAVSGEAVNDWELPTPVRPVSLIVRIDQGYKSRVGTVTIRGNVETRDDVVRREIALYADEYYNRNYLEGSLNRLRRTLWFEQQAPGAGVRHRTSSRMVTQGDSILEYTDFAFELEEGRTGTFNISAGYNTGTGFTLSVELEKRNFNIRGLIDLFFGKTDFTGGGQYLQLSVTPPVDRRQKYAVSFKEPWFFGYPFEVGIGAEYSTHDFGLYSTSRAGVDPYIGWRATSDFSLSLGYSLSNISLFDIGQRAPEEIRRDRGSETISTLSLEARWDTRDSPFFATRGWLLSARYAYSGGILGGTLDFWRLILTGKYHIPVVRIDEMRTLVLSFAADARWQDVHSDTTRIPFSQRFLLGGNSPSGVGTLRGYRLFGVGPSRDKQAIGGNFMTTFTMELRLPILPGSLYFVTFVDAGELSGSLSTFDPRGVSVSAGFGFRIVLPVLPVPFALDFGFPIYNQPGNREEVISINLGFGF